MCYYSPSQTVRAFTFFSNIAMRLWRLLSLQERLWCLLSLQERVWLILIFLAPPSRNAIFLKMDLHSLLLQWGLLQCYTALIHSFSSRDWKTKQANVLEKMLGYLPNLFCILFATNTHSVLLMHSFQGFVIPSFIM